MLTYAVLAALDGGKGAVALVSAEVNPKFTCCTSTKVQILTLTHVGKGAGVVCNYLLYWYKGTNTDAKTGTKVQILTLILVQKYKY
jgi:hypothetical protein